jgi:hypothetical protein
VKLLAAPLLYVLTNFFCPIIYRRGPGIIWRRNRRHKTPIKSNAKLNDEVVPAETSEFFFFAK